METSIVQKKELIEMLEVINKQLEKLELSMVNNMSQYQSEWQRRQDTQMEECGKQLDLLEMKISSSEEQHENNKATSLRLKLSY